MQEELPLHRTIVIVDVARFTDPARTMTDQAEVQRALYEMLARAFSESGIDLQRCIVEDRGDGMLILLPTDAPNSLLADRLPGRLVTGLKRHNATHTEAASFQLRVGLHAGEVRMNSNGAVSPAINAARRIVDAEEAKRALRLSNQVLAIIASDLFYREVIRPDPGVNPERYRQIPVVVKETSSMAWLWLPEGPVVREVFPHLERDDLRELLTKVTVPQLATLAHRACGPAGAPAGQYADAWQAFECLMDLNAGGDGFPPALEFVRLLAGHVHNPLKARLDEWVSRQASRLGLEPALRARSRAAPAVSTRPADPRLHLLLMVEHDGIDPSRFLLSSWRQEDPDEWPPVRGETQEVPLAELEYRVDELIVAAERAWYLRKEEAALEFLLPRALLSLPVPRWHKEHASGWPTLLCKEYPIVVRSLERMASPEWHRVWRRRWQTIAENPADGRVHFCRRSDPLDPSTLDEVLGSPEWTLVVLDKAPSAEPVSEAEDELTAALRAGIPALIWHPQVPSEGLREIVDWLVEGGGMGDLPARARESRREPLDGLPRPFDIDLARGVVILWDDPARTVFLDRPRPLPGPRRKSADERERASR